MGASAGQIRAGAAFVGLGTKDSGLKAGVDAAADRPKDFRPMVGHLGGVVLGIGRLTAAARLETGMTVFGHRAIQHLNVFGASREKFDALKQEGKDKGLTLKEEDVIAGKQLNMQWNQMTQSLRMLAAQIGAGM